MCDVQKFLGLLQVRTAAYARDKDAYSPCTGPANDAPATFGPLHQARL
jgi:hypothetical protein